MNALVVDQFPILRLDRVSAKDSPFHNDIWSCDIVHVETEKDGKVD